MTLISPQTLKKILPDLSEEKAQAISDKLNFCCPARGINTLDIFEEFLATIIHESAEFTRKEENLYYSHPETLVKTWPSHFPSIEFANQYIKNPQKLGEYIYGSTSIAHDLGNITPADGFVFKGIGFIQMTGRKIITAYAQDIKISSAEEVVELIKNDDHYAIDSACWVYVVNKKLIKASIDDQFITITKRINGGTVGLEQREHYYDLVKKYLYNK